MEKKIIFIHQNKAHLPEIEAYKKYFGSHGFETHDIVYQDLVKKDISSFENIILWYFMGFYPRKINAKLVIHDYRSLSTGRIAKAKDYLKRILNFKPHLRIFLNEEVRKNFSFDDGIPYLTIDMGLPLSIVNYIDLDTKPKYDFIYVGAVSYEREIHKLIKKFIARYGDSKSLLLVGMFDPKLKKEFDSFQNIIFTGKISQEEVFKFIKESGYSICIIPNKYPHSLQTPTKLLEYLALKSKIIVNRNPMVLKILKETNNINNVFIMDENWNLPEQNILKSIRPSSICVEYFLWDAILKRSGILEEIEKIPL